MSRSALKILLEQFYEDYFEVTEDTEHFTARDEAIDQDRVEDEYDAPDIPEDYHIALVYYAAYNFYMKRKDVGLSNQFVDKILKLLSSKGE